LFVKIEKENQTIGKKRRQILENIFEKRKENISYQPITYYTTEYC